MIQVFNAEQAPPLVMVNDGKGSYVFLGTFFTFKLRKACFNPCPLVIWLVALLAGWFVRWITLKLLNRFPPNVDGCVMAQNGPH